jgi:hypothetical protein
MNKEIWFLEFRLPVRLSVCADLRLASSWAVGRILLIFDIQGFVRHRSVPEECKYYSSKIGALHMAPKHKMAIFSKMALTIRMKCQQFTEILSLNKSV